MSSLAPGYVSTEQLQLVPLLKEHLAKPKRKKN